MRARYYSPEHKRFVNADILHGGITDSTSLNRYAYVNGNPVSFVDPTGMSVDENRGNYRIPSVKSIGYTDCLLAHYGGTPIFEAAINPKLQEWMQKNIGTAVIVGSDYDILSLGNFFYGYETGVSLGKEYSGDYKLIEFVREKSPDANFLKDKYGIKINSGENGGKLSIGLKSMSIEWCVDEVYGEVILESNKLGITQSYETDWKEYDVGRYDSMYIRPGGIALAAVVVVVALKLVGVPLPA